MVSLRSRSLAAALLGLTTAAAWTNQNGTNAERLARGLPPKTPRRLYNATIPRAAKPKRSNSPTLQNIQVSLASGSNGYMYIDQDGYPDYTTDPNTATTFAPRDGGPSTTQSAIQSFYEPQLFGSYMEVIAYPSYGPLTATSGCGMLQLGPSPTASNANPSNAYYAFMTLDFSSSSGGPFYINYSSNTSFSSSDILYAWIGGEGGGFLYFVAGTLANAQQCSNYPLDSSHQVYSFVFSPSS